jgi:Xaa-Pro dipeptidase
VALTRHANDISTIAHTAVLKAVKHAKNERELEGLFIEKSISHGAREQAYHSIVASMCIPDFSVKCLLSRRTFDLLHK